MGPRSQLALPQLGRGVLANSKRPSLGTLNGGNLVVVGDSISCVGGGPAGTTTWPTLIAGVYTSLQLRDQAISGQRASEIAVSGTMATQILANYDGTKLFNILAIYAGANDIALDLHDGPTVYSSITTIVAYGKAHGFKVVVCTCNDLVLDGTQETDLLLPYNALIRSNSAGADAVADPFTALGPNNGSPRPPNFFDDLHPSQTGQGVEQSTITPVLLSVV